MKVNTDGILLGAWADVTNAKNILDIGTGSGLISLMLAQRSSENAAITALEIDKSAATQATQNIKQSPWPDKTNVLQQDLLTWQTDTKFDFIVSNPPFFSASLKNSDQQKATARHNDQLSFDKLVKCAEKLANQGARFCVIIPHSELPAFIEALQETTWQQTKLTLVKHNQQKPALRVLLEMTISEDGSKDLHTITNTELLIKNNEGGYSEEFRRLCKDFYLKM